MLKKVLALFRKEEGTNFEQSFGVFEKKALKEEDDFVKVFAKFKEDFKMASDRVLNEVSLFEQAKLPNPDISTHEFQLFEGNRKEFCRKTRSFVENIDLEDVDRFYDCFRDRFANWSNGVEHNCSILLRFLEHECRAVVGSVQRVKELVDVLSKQDRRPEIKKAQNAIREFNDAKKEREDLLKNIDALKNTLKILELNKQKFEAGIREIKQDPELAQQVDSLEKLKIAIKSSEEEVIKLFSVCEGVLRRYEKLEPISEKLVEGYLANPVSALASDPNLRICLVSKAILDEVKSDRIKAKPDVQKALKTINKKYLGDFLREFAVVKIQERQKTEALKSSPLYLKLSVMEKGLDENNSRYVSVQEELRIAEKSVERINLDELKKKVIEFLAVFVKVRQE